MPAANSDSLDFPKWASVGQDSLLSQGIEPASALSNSPTSVGLMPTLHLPGEPQLEPMPLGMAS